MTILDIDLDFFLDDVVTFPDGSRGAPRLDAHRATPWSIADTREFLEGRCGLSASAPVPGATVTNHHEVFYKWRELISAGQLTTPFDVVHIDAHADLGLGDTGWVYILGELLHKPVQDRAWPKEGSGGLAFGNYLAFAIACRWVRELKFVLHREWRDDLPAYYFAGRRPGQSPPPERLPGRHRIELQMRPYDPADLEAAASYRRRANPLPAEPEPVVLLKTVPACEFEASCRFHFAFLSQSPSCTPQASDELLALISAYIQPRWQNPGMRPGEAPTGRNPSV